MNATQRAASIDREDGQARPAADWPDETGQSADVSWSAGATERAGRVIFATGIECSYPVVLGPDGRPQRRDELALCDHYGRWREDLHLVRELGLRYLRYGPPLHRVWQGPDRYDWSFTDEVFAELRVLGIVPIVDLCHFGLPDWLGNSFQNPEFHHRFGDYAGAFARRYPWVRLYTPVNEIYACAKFSGLMGWWNERGMSDRTFVTALKHMCLATLDAIGAILAVRPDAIFVQSESSEMYHESCVVDEARRLAAFENERRFLALDAIYAHPLSAAMDAYVRQNGMTQDDLDRFTNHSLGECCVMGNDYYVSNEHLVMNDLSIRDMGEIYGWYLVTRQYYNRYRRPVMHTETNTLHSGLEGPYWLWKQWHNVMQMRAEGVPVVGFTWYSLTDQIDWDSSLHEVNGNVNSVGLYDLDRKIRPVGQEYRQLVEIFGQLPTVPHATYFSFR